ncbi:MAG TPA: SDR family oxidoreductase [Gemmatimonadaceae bacterium]|nr:SDR family oxidoreductase [Gemmatimonadaceae bacterium]
MSHDEGAARRGPQAAPRDERDVKLHGAVALVTGAGRRVGRAIAIALGAEGMRVAVHYHSSRTGAAETVATIQAAGGEAWAVQADLSDAHAAAPLVQGVAAHYGALQVLINSAAIMMRTPLETVTPHEWDTMEAINLRAPFFCAQAAAAIMREQGGVIVNIADLAGMETWPAYIPHGITKAGVLFMTRALARALAPTIRVNAVVPGSVLLPESWSAEDAARLARTTPLRRLGSPADVAQAVVYLLQADYVTGDALVVDGGRHVR